MKTFDELTADLSTHHIEGIAREGMTPFSCPLISRIDDQFWQGGCRDGVNLGGYFKHIISLYPWERFSPGGELDSLTEVRLYDGPTVPHTGLLAALALIRSGSEPADAIARLRAGRSPAVLCNKTFERWLLTQGLR